MYKKSILAVVAYASMAGMSTVQAGNEGLQDRPVITAKKMAEVAGCLTIAVIMGGFVLPNRAHVPDGMTMIRCSTFGSQDACNTIENYCNTVGPNGQHGIRSWPGVFDCADSCWQVCTPNEALNNCEAQDLD